MLIEQDTRQCDAQCQQHCRRGTELFFHFMLDSSPRNQLRI